MSQASFIESISPEDYNTITSMVGNVTSRPACVEKFGWGLIAPKELCNLVNYLKEILSEEDMKHPILSVGCGKHTVESAMAHHNVKFVLTDLEPCKGDACVSEADCVRAMLRHAPVCKVLFSSWPPYDSSMLSEGLQAVRVVNPEAYEYLIYIGEGPLGSTGSYDMHEYLEDHYDILRRFECCQWPGIADECLLFRRKQ